MKAKGPLALLESLEEVRGRAGVGGLTGVMLPSSGRKT